MRKLVFFSAALVLALTGCVSPRQMTLFSSDSQSIAIPQAPVFTIESNDSIRIEVTAVNKNTVRPYNSSGSSYAVDSKGMVELPVVGKVQLAGKTIDEAEQLLKEKISDQVLNPIVRVAITNAVVTILGEVNAPASLKVPMAITLPDALGRVGGLTKNARCKDVLVQRREKGMIKSYHINLLSDELFSSPCYYLQKGDVVVISPLRAQ